jgi:ABC-2 type transport system permease protein
MPRLQLELVDQDHSPLSQQLAGLLRQQAGIEITGRAGAQLHLVIPQGFADRIEARAQMTEVPAADTPQPELLQLRFAPTTPPPTKALAVLMTRQALQAVQSDYLLRAVLGLPEDKVALMRYLGDPARLPVSEGFSASDGTALDTPTSVQQNVPAWLIFALFFTVIPLATTFVTEHSQGSLLRLRALGVGALELFASKLLPYYVVNLLQMALMLALGVWVVPWLGGDRLALGHSPLGLWLITSATSFCAIGLALLVAVCARTTMQATIAGGALSLLMAALGGIMVPRLVMPPHMQQLTQVSPMAWSLEGFWDIVLRQGDWRAPLGECAALAVLGLLSLLLAGLVYRRHH